MSGSHAYGGDCPGMIGAHHYGGGGLGVLGSLIAHGGTNGDGYGYKSIALPADANKEYYFLLGTKPAGLTFSDTENTDFAASANDGTYVYPFTEYEWGTSLGSSSFSLVFGGAATAPGSTLTGTSTIAAGTANGASAGSAPGATLTGASTITAGAATGGGSVAATAPGATITGTSSILGGYATNGTAPYVSPSRTVNFGGGTNRVDFDGGTNRVDF